MTISRFELEYGYTPCSFTFGRNLCPFRGDTSGGCTKTTIDCMSHGCLHAFGGFPSVDPEVIAARREALVAEWILQQQDSASSDAP